MYTRLLYCAFHELENWAGDLFGIICMTGLKNLNPGLNPGTWIVSTNILGIMIFHVYVFTNQSSIRSCFVVRAENVLDFGFEQTLVGVSKCLFGDHSRFSP